ncbi:MAG TPA: tRNA-specific adenosine deaminase, partial [Casimicrobiaceae bacterium]|nr:tRNA-specific adenosine deaminase [Casimicrobiaceae bacterium]
MPSADETWIGEALALAQIAAARGEVPVGAIVVRDNAIIGR